MSSMLKEEQKQDIDCQAYSSIHLCLFDSVVREVSHEKSIMYL